jgi:hypothetical protein
MLQVACVNRHWFLMPGDALPAARSAVEPLACAD